MPRRPDPTLRPAIVEKVTAHLRDTALEDVSVRSLGRVIGSSAYPIVYHFGSREALIDAVVEHLAARAEAVPLDPEGDADALGAYLVAVFGALDDPDRALAARLAFELGSVEALGERHTHRALHRRQVDVLTAWCVLHGVDDHDGACLARSAVLEARGVQWGWLVDADAIDVAPALRDVADRLASAVRARAPRTSTRA